MLQSHKKESEVKGETWVLYTQLRKKSRAERKDKQGNLNGKLISTASMHPPVCAVWNLHPLHSTQNSSHTLNSNSWFRKKTIHFKKHAYLMKAIWCKHRDCTKFTDLNDGEEIKSYIPNLSTVWHVYTGMGTLYCQVRINQYRKIFPKNQGLSSTILIWYFQSHLSFVASPTICHHSFLCNFGADFLI